MTSPLFFEGLGHDLGLVRLLKVLVHQAPFLVFEFFDARHHRHVHAAVLGPPLLKRRRADTQLAANIWDTYASFNPFD